MSDVDERAERRLRNMVEGLPTHPVPDLEAAPSRGVRRLPLAVGALAAIAAGIAVVGIGLFLIGRPPANDGIGTVGSQPVGSIPRCSTVDRISAPAELYRDAPVYVGNEQPTEEIRAWATAKPGFEELWLDRDHLGWITVAFSTDADARQAELEELFPDVGVVAVGVDWTAADLEALQRRVGEELGPLFTVSSSTSIDKGVVNIYVAYLTDERLRAIEARFAGERVCVQGGDPSDRPSQGPQPLAGDGWRLLADEPGVGAPYRTGIAFDPASLRALWAEIGLDAEAPDVDFMTEVVIWFGEVYSGSCPELRLDGVVVNHERQLVHAEIVNTGEHTVCTADANPRAYVVALERSRLPAGPFAIQLDADDPPGGAPEERTLVDVDLSQPGAVAGPGQVHPDSATPEPDIPGPGDFIETGFESPFRLYVHCGIEWLGELNRVQWKTDVPVGTTDYVPTEWRDAVEGDQTIVVTVLLEEGPEPRLTATANGHSVVYLPASEDPPGCD